MFRKLSAFLYTLVLCILILVPNVLCEIQQELYSKLDVEDDHSRNVLRGIAWKCVTPGKVFKPNNHTTCTCTGLLIADCKADVVEPSTTTPSSISSTTRRTPTTTQKPPPAASHPLDPLTPDEIRRARDIFKNATTKTASSYIYNWITLQEPPKADLLQYFLTDVDPPRTAYQRKAFLILIEKGTGNVYEAVVNLDTGRVESFNDIPTGFQPTSTPDDDNLAVAVVKADPIVQERCRQVGYPNMSLVHAAAWSLGYVGDRQEYRDLKRPYNMFLFGMNFEDDNRFAHPFDFMVVVDIIQERVIAIEELPTHNDFDASNKEGNVVPRTPDNYDYKLRPPNFLRKNDKPIKVASPEGPSYKINGNAIEWQNFKMRIGFNAREGLVIYNVLYDDNGKKRPILYRASLGEVGVGYADPRPPFHRKVVFDMGEAGLGFKANELIDQEQCIGETYFLDGYLNNNTGDPKTVKNAICITEEDDGILWQHFDAGSSRTVATRSHRLAISFVFTGGNYDFVMRWLFYQDASIQFQTRLSGILSTSMIALNAIPGRFGSSVFPQVDGQYHQHYFSLRLDTEIDGNENSVYMSEAVPLEEDENPYGNGFGNKRTLLKTASEARTNTNAETGRAWVVVNPNKDNKYTERPNGWKLSPLITTPLMVKRDSPLHPKVAYLDYDFWVTKYQEGQLYSGGLYLNNSGLPEWVANDPNTSVVNTDIVIWHNFRSAHIPRIEDFPVMPFEDLNVWFKPYNFFLENPGLNVPPTEVNREKTEL